MQRGPITYGRARVPVLSPKGSLVDSEALDHPTWRKILVPPLQRVGEARAKVDLMKQERRYRHDHLGGAQPLVPCLYAHRSSLLDDRVCWVFQEELPALLLDSLCERLCQGLEATLHSILLCPPRRRGELRDASAAAKI